MVKVQLDIPQRNVSGSPNRSPGKARHWTPGWFRSLIIGLTTAIVAELGIRSSVGRKN